MNLVERIADVVKQIGGKIRVIDIIVNNLSSRVPFLENYLGQDEAPKPPSLNDLQY